MHKTIFRSNSDIKLLFAIVYFLCLFSFLYAQGNIVFPPTPRFLYTDSEIDGLKDRSKNIEIQNMIK